MKARATAAVAFFILLVLVTPPPDPRYPLCGFHWLTGIPCALCGLTRGVFALAKGQVAAAVHWNALSPLGFLMLFSLFSKHPLRGALWTFGMAAFAGYGVWRVVVASV